MSKKLLSICIPTWNRAKLLEDLLSELTSQIISCNIQNKIELIISNNGSTDNTEEVVLHFQKNYNFIVYNNNGVNKGGRYNLFKAFDLATGEYLIFLGDDDRYKEDGCKKIIDSLESHENIGILIDSHLFKKNIFGKEAFVSLKQLLENFYYYIGNAGLFVIKNSYVKKALNNFKHENFNGSWPQTQLIVLGANENPNDLILIKDLDTFSQSLHDKVMIYSSYYLWRTTYFDLVESIESIKKEIGIEVYLSAKKYFSKNITQNFFNILQCGVFLDDKKTRLNTSKHIFSNLKYFSIKEKFFLSVAALILATPTFITRLFSNSFIYLLRGQKGINKKNNFVESEQKKIRTSHQSKVVRTFVFE